MMRVNGDSGKRRVLVTGGAGYIGSQVVRMLLARGFRVRVLDSFLFGAGGLAAVLDNKNLQVMRGDIRDVLHVREAMNGVDSVIALAALVGDPMCDIHPATTVAVNFEATGILAKCARLAGVQRLVFASSCSVYGSSGQAIVDENGPPRPVSLYAKTRLLSEKLLLGEHPVIGPVILRLSTVFGLSPRMRFDLLVNTMTARALAEGKLTVINGDHWRPLVHIDDAARAFVCALDAPGDQVDGQILNVGANSLNFTIADIASVVARCAKGATIYEARRPQDDRSYRVRFDRIRSVLSYEPCWSLGEGIAQVVDALRDGTIVDYRQQIYHNADLHQSSIG